MFVIKQKINRVNHKYVRVRPFSSEDSLDMVLEIVNEAYKIEIGNTGIAFKELDRLRDVSDIVKEETHLALLGKEIVGVVGIKLTKDKAHLGELSMSQPRRSKCWCTGPLAVRPGLQKRGIGKVLLNYAEKLRERCEVTVVSCRTDLVGYYQNRGYRYSVYC